MEVIKYPSNSRQSNRVAHFTLGNGLICSWMNNARTNSAVQSGVSNPTWGDQSSDRLGYDGSGRAITKRFLSGGIDGTTHAYSNTSAVLGFTTAYDPSGNKLYERHLHAENRSHLYQTYSGTAPEAGSYDSLDRLLQYQRGTLSSTGGPGNRGGGSISTPISLTSTNVQRTYALDGLGNWRRTGYTPVGGSLTDEIRQHNGLNEITRITIGGSTTDFNYDGTTGHSNGNLANDGTCVYRWDALNRLMEVQRVSDGAVIQQAAYDALNRRVRVTVSNDGLPENSALNGSTDCLYLGWRCVEERQTISDIDTPTKQYTWGIYLDELLQQRQLVALNGFAASAAADLYPLQDLLYRTTGLADSSGTIREAYDTDAYGNTIILRNAGTPPSAITWSSETQVNNPTCTYIYTGQRFDTAINAYYYKARYYIPRWDRFASKDPIGYDGGFANLYVYVGSYPTIFTDPLGLQLPGQVQAVCIEINRDKCGKYCTYQCTCPPGYYSTFAAQYTRPCGEPPTIWCNPFPPPKLKNPEPVPKLTPINPKPVLIGIGIGIGVIAVIVIIIFWVFSGICGRNCR